MNFKTSNVNSWEGSLEKKELLDKDVLRTPSNIYDGPFWGKMIMASCH